MMDSTNHLQPEYPGKLRYLIYKAEAVAGGFCLLISVYSYGLGIAAFRASEEVKPYGIYLGPNFLESAAIRLFLLAVIFFILTFLGRIRSIYVQCGFSIAALIVLIHQSWILGYDFENGISTWVIKYASWSGGLIYFSYILMGLGIVLIGLYIFLAISRIRIAGKIDK